MTLFLNTVAARLTAILHEASDREWHAEREGEGPRERWNSENVCRVVRDEEVCLKVCALMSLCNVCGMVGWHAEFVIALPHVKDWPRDRAVYLACYVCCVRVWWRERDCTEWLCWRLMCVSRGQTSIGRKTHRLVQNNVHAWIGNNLQLITLMTQSFSCQHT